MRAGLGSLLLTAALLLAGCQTPIPPRPAMAPFGVNGDFGFTDRDLGENIREVEYVGAPISVPASSVGTEPAIGPEQDKVRDLALWRAAEIALAGGFAGFKVRQETRDNDFMVREEIVPQPFWYPYYGFYSPYYHRPFWFAEGYGTYNTRQRASLRARITMRIELFEVLDPDDPELLDAAAIKAEMAARRTGAAY